MAFRRWFRRRYPSRYSRYRRRYRRYRSGRRFVNGSSRSSIRVKIPVTYTHSLTQPSGTHGTDVDGICPLTQTTTFVSSALSSPLYRTYCLLYDEVKVIGFKANINITSSVGGSDLPSLEILTSFDRRFGSSEDYPTYADLRTYSTYQAAMAVNNSIAKLTRSIYASDLMEKAQWHDCTLLEAAGEYTDRAYQASARNPNFFVPMLFIAFNCPDTSTSKTISYTAEITYYFSFRNPKYGAGSSSAKSSVEYLPRTAVDGPGDVDDPGMMDIADLSLDDDVRADIESQRVPVTAMTSSRSTSSLNAERRAADRASRRNPNV